MPLFEKGTSGNPGGRPKGSRNKSTVMCMNLLDGAGEDVMKRAIELAKEGNPVAMRLCVDRLIPRGQRPVLIDMAKLEKASDLAQAARDVVQAAADGGITLTEARDFL